MIDATLGHRRASGVDFGLAGATTGSRPTMQQHQFRGYPQQGVPRPPAPGHHGVPPNRVAPRGGMSTYRASHLRISLARARSLVRVATSAGLFAISRVPLALARPGVARAPRLVPPNPSGLCEGPTGPSTPCVERSHRYQTSLRNKNLVYQNR